MKILFIGNSFSSDLTKYLQKVSGGELYVRNLYIGGCSLEMHAKNIAEASEEYDYCIDAEATRKISVNEALTLEAWDVISVQQVSGFSGIVERAISIQLRISFTAKAADCIAATKIAA